MFLDREPYIRFWGPFYARYGGTIQRLKALVSGRRDRGSAVRRIEQRLSAIEVQNQQTAAVLEQLLLAVINDRGLSSFSESLNRSFTDRLSAHTAQLNAANEAQWRAVERLLIAALGSSCRQSLAAETMYQALDDASRPQG